MSPVQVMLSVLFPPLILLLGFRSREELKTMPQTREEHQDDDLERSSDSETDSESDEENIDMRNDHDPEVKTKLFVVASPRGNTSVTNP